MTPFWIVNFLEGDSCESFFQSYWSAIESNSPGDAAPRKFFHITDGKAANLTKEELNEIAYKRLSMDSADVQKLIPAFTKNQGNKLNVFFFGDITQERTIERLHTWAAYLMQKRIENPQQPWYSISNVKMYAVLLRPENITVDEKLLNSRVRGFLNELNSLESMDMNHRPFNKVLFLQAPLDKAGRAAAEQSACLATYHIARTEGRCFNANDNILYCDSSASAVFFEAQVQKEIDAYNLGCIMLKDMCDNQGEEFLNVKEARDFVDSEQAFIDSFKPANTKLFYISEAPHIPNLEITKFSCNLSLLNIVPIWKYYNTKHIEKVIDHVTEELKVFEKDFIRSMNIQQHKFIFGNARRLLDLVFQMFCEKNPERFKHIGIQQAFSVLEHFKTKIGDAFRSVDKVPHAFTLPAYLAKLLSQSKRVDLSANALKDELIREMDKLPKFKKDTLVSSLSTGVVLSAALFFINPWFLLVFPLAVLIGAIVFIIKANKLEALKDLFVGAKLRDILARLDEHAANLQGKTVSETKQYMQWIKEKKLSKLQDEMHTIAPPEFHFQTSPVFQPLVWTKLSEDNSSQLAMSGSFGTAPLIKNIPPVQLYSNIESTTVGLYDLVKSHKDTVQELVQALMYSDEDITDTAEEQVAFQRHETAAMGNDMLLLLDVSGSMYSDMDALKQYVHDLESVGNIEWIAFDDKVVATSKDTDIDNLSAGGGTCFVPAINKAVEWLGTNSYDTIILLSDGCPSESVNKIVEAADGLNMPLNTIAVGASADENTLTEIAIRTGGKEVTVESFEQITTPDVWKNEIMPNVEVLERGCYTFGELMKHTHIEACAIATRKFALRRLDDYSLSIPTLFDGHVNEPGFKEWLTLADQRNTLSPSAPQMPSMDAFATAEDKRNEKTENEIKRLCRQSNISSLLNPSPDEPDMVLSLLSLNPLLSISDLQWASSMKHGDATLNDPKALKEMMGVQGQIVNIYGETIKP